MTAENGLGQASAWRRERKGEIGSPIDGAPFTHLQAPRGAARLNAYARFLLGEADGLLLLPGDLDRALAGDLVGFAGDLGAGLAGDFLGGDLAGDFLGVGLTDTLTAEVGDVPFLVKANSSGFVRLTGGRALAGSLGLSPRRRAIERGLRHI